MSQRAMLATTLAAVEGLDVTLGRRCSESHAAPWEQGATMWRCVRDTLALCR